MRIPILLTLVLVAVVVLEPRTAAQPLAYSLFERYLDALRQQAGIPGLSAAIVQDRRIAWQAAFGRRDIESGAPATDDTPYFVGDLTQTFAVVLLGQCAERGELSIDDPISRWTSAVPEPNVTVRHVLAHASDAAARGFRYDPGRYQALTSVVQACTETSYRRALADEVLDRLGMTSSVPGTDLADPEVAEAFGFDEAVATRYAAVLSRVATPYRVDRNGRATRMQVEPSGLNAAIGLVSTVRDLARYDAALDDGVLLRPDVLSIAWRNAVFEGRGPLPTGLGWFVQTYNTERLVWHFGMSNGYSSLMLKVPGRDLTLILLANSNGLSATFSLAEGDVTRSLFARTFLRLFL